MAELGIDPKRLDRMLPKKRLYREKFVNRKKHNPIIDRFIELDKEGSGILREGWKGKKQKKVIFDLTKKYGKGGLNAEDLRGLLYELEKSNDPKIRRHFRRRDAREIAKSLGLKKIKRRYQLDKYDKENLVEKSQSNQEGQRYSFGNYFKEQQQEKREAYKRYSNRASEAFRKSRENVLKGGDVDPEKSDPYSNLGGVSGSTASTRGSKFSSTKSNLF